jgi:hypothetical protein
VLHVAVIALPHTVMQKKSLTCCPYFKMMVTNATDQMFQNIFVRMVYNRSSLRIKFLVHYANARVKRAKMGHSLCSSWLLCCSVYFLCCSLYFCVLCIVCFVRFLVLFVCICVLNNCHWVATQLQLNIYHNILQ